MNKVFETMLSILMILILLVGIGWIASDINWNNAVIRFAQECKSNGGVTAKLDRSVICINENAVLNTQRREW